MFWSVSSMRASASLCTPIGSIGFGSWFHVALYDHGMWSSISGEWYCGKCFPTPHLPQWLPVSTGQQIGTCTTTSTGQVLTWGKGRRTKKMSSRCVMGSGTETQKTTFSSARAKRWMRTQLDCCRLLFWWYGPRRVRRTTSGSSCWYAIRVPDCLAKAPRETLWGRDISPWCHL